MSKFEIAQRGTDYFVRRETTGNKNSLYDYFAGYDFMGSVNWADRFSMDYRMDLDEALSVLEDLKAAGE